MLVAAVRLLFLHPVLFADADAVHAPEVGKSVLAFLHRLAMPLTKLAEKLMATIGIDLRRRQPPSTAGTNEASLWIWISRKKQKAPEERAEVGRTAR